jgi:diaminohydroxyphosphoribosylaminopyrimidine deaminase/5-amino-6-(5-phosphoribosylamino)uracil reductase
MAAGHILRVTERRPLVQAKLALGADGAVPRGRKGQPVWATGPAARAAGHLMRARADAILVGRQTVIDDDPLLTCRLPGLEQRSPIRIVLARQLAGLETSRLARTAREHPLWVVCGRDGDAAALAAVGARIFRVPEIGGELWLPSVMEALVAEGITRLLVEGGPSTWRAFSSAGLIDEAVLFSARKRGADLSGAHAVEALQRYVATTNLQLFDHRTVGSDDMMVFRRHWRSLGSPAGRAKTN